MGSKCCLWGAKDNKLVDQITKASEVFVYVRMRNVYYETLAETFVIFSKVKWGLNSNA